ncbi:MAG: hypothetical protein KH222_03705 [Butyricicoccus pullicaecorum]|nr:hypothetical protein [Butyricicoccus pullicaecorum]
MLCRKPDFVRFPQVMPRLMSQIERIPHRALELHVTGEQVTGAAGSGVPSGMLFLGLSGT